MKNGIVTTATLVVPYVEALSSTTAFYIIVYHVLSTATPRFPGFFFTMTFTTSMCRGIIFPLYKIKDKDQHLYTIVLCV